MPQVIEKPWHLMASLYQMRMDAVCSERIPYVEGASLLTAAGADLYCFASGKKLMGRQLLWKGCEYRLFDLLSSAFEGDASIYEKMRIVAPDESLTDVFSLTYERDSTPKEEENFDALLNTAYHFRRNILKADDGQPPVVSWLSALEQIVAHDDDDKARQASIVDLAHELPMHLEKVIRQPRRALTRIRDLERIQRVREVDKACLINLARRPGIGIAEKAGPSQRILAVRRQETNNTLENRVTRHCCRLIRRAVDHYLALHYDVKEEESPRMQVVHKFQRKAITWEKSEALSGVTALASPCKSPNYVLLQNPHYMRIWKAYRLLVKNEEVRANVWRWKHQLWKEIATIGFAQLFSAWIESLNEDEYPVNISVAEERIVGGARGFTQGHFLNTDILPGPYILGSSKKEAGTLYLVDSFGLQKIDDSSSIHLMNADFYMIWEGPSDRKVVPVYCRPLGKGSQDENFEAEDANQHLDGGAPELCGVILLRPALDEEPTRLSIRQSAGCPVLNMNLSISPQKWVLSEGHDLSAPLQWMMR